MRKVEGFTLIELAIVIVIVGILSAVAVPKYQDLSRQAQLAGCSEFLQSLQSAAAVYVAQETFVPTLFSDFVTTGTANPPFTLTVLMLNNSGHVNSIVPANLGSTQMTVNLKSGAVVVYYLNGSDITATIPP